MLKADKQGRRIAILHLLIVFLPPILSIYQLHVQSFPSFINKLDVFLLNFLWIGIGFQGVMAGISQIFHGERTANYLNWTFSPFVRELGYCNFAFGIIGLACLLTNFGWWAATGIGYSIFLLCAASEHIYDAMVNKNYSLGNIGPTLWSDIIIPIAVLGLLFWHYCLLTA